MLDWEPLAGRGIAWLALAPLGLFVSEPGRSRGVFVFS